MSDAHPTTFEEFREIPGIEGYRVWSDGTIQGNRKSGNGFGKRGKWKNLRPALDRTGYRFVALRVDGRYKICRIHSLVLTAFVGPRPEGMECCHGDGNPLNNHISNLRWDTGSGNMADCLLHGTRLLGEHHPNSKLKADQVREIRKLRATGMYQKDLARRFGVSNATIQDLLNGNTWNHVE